MNRYVPIMFSTIFLLIVFLPSQVLAVSITETKAAIGKDCEASGSYSTAMGLETIASGWASTAMGDNTIASGSCSWAGGSHMQLTTAAYHTFVWGFSCSEQSISTANAFLIFPAGTSSGKVGIGTPSPEAKLEVKIPDTDNLTGILIDSDETGDFRALWIDAETTTRNAAFIRGKYPLQLIQDISSGYGLYVTRNISEAGSQPLVKFKDDNPANEQTTLEVRQDGSGDILNLFQGSTNEVFTVLADGNVGIGTSGPGEKLDIVDGNGRVETGHSWLTSSDCRLKKNISTLEGSLEKISRLCGVRFDSKESVNLETGSGKHIGVIAQELEKEYPELVVGDEKTGYKAVAYDKLTAVLIEAVKELKTENQTQKEMLEKQQTEIEELRSMIRGLKS